MRIDTDGRAFLDVSDAVREQMAALEFGGTSVPPRPYVQLSAGYGEKPSS